MRPSIGLRPRQLRELFNNYLQIGDYYWSANVHDHIRYQQLLTKRYGTTTLAESMKLSDAQCIEAAMEALGQPQRIRPLIRKLWRNKLVWGVMDLVWDLDYYRKFGKWPTPV